MRRAQTIFAVTILGAGLLVLAAPTIPEAQGEIGSGVFGVRADEARAAYRRAQSAAEKAAERAEQLEDAARDADEAAERTRREVAALAAKVQQTEAGIAGAEARLELARTQSDALDAKLAEKRRPLTSLAAALQNMARRPLALAALRPGSLKDAVYVRAVLATTLPEVRAQTAGLRQDIERQRALELETGTLLDELREAEVDLGKRRAELGALAAKQRVARRAARGAAIRENERALVLAEEARDLDALVGQLDTQSTLRQQLAALPGPRKRPPRPGRARVDTRPSLDLVQTGNAPPSLQLPVEGRTVSGFGETRGGGERGSDLVIAPIARAQIVSPGKGRIAFAGPYRGYGEIVIIAHDGGWTSLVTGLAARDVAVGDTVIGGSPLGRAGEANPQISFELRRDGKPVNPLQFM